MERVNGTIKPDQALQGMKYRNLSMQLCSDVRKAQTIILLYSSRKLFNTIIMIVDSTH